MSAIKRSSLLNPRLGSASQSTSTAVSQKSRRWSAVTNAASILQASSLAETCQVGPIWRNGGSSVSRHRNRTTLLWSYVCPDSRSMTSRSPSYDSSQPPAKTNGRSRSACSAAAQGGVSSGVAARTRRYAARFRLARAAAWRAMLGGSPWCSKTSRASTELRRGTLTCTGSRWSAPTGTMAWCPFWIAWPTSVSFVNVGIRIRGPGCDAKKRHAPSFSTRSERPRNMSRRSCG